MERTLYIFITVVVTLVKISTAESSALDKFFASGFNKDTDYDNKYQEKSPEAAKEDLINLLGRAGLIDPNGQLNSPQLNNLQTLYPQQQSYFDQAEQSQLTNYVSPVRQPQSSIESSSYKFTSTSPKDKSEDAPVSLRDSSPKITKADRQGLYIEDGNLMYHHEGDQDGYSGHQDGYSGHQDGYSGHQDGYSGHIQPKDTYEAKEGYSGGGYHGGPFIKVGVKKPSVSIKIEPLEILKKLLRLIPRPKLNLNGKVFLGVELGKNIGLGKPAPPKYGPPKKGISVVLG